MLDNIESQMICIENWTKKNTKCRFDDAPVCVLSFQVLLTIALLICLHIIQQCPKNNEAKQLWECYHEANQSRTPSCKENHQSRTHTTLDDKWIEGEQEQDMIMAVEESSHFSFSSSQTILHRGDFTCPIYDWGHAKEANWVVLFFLSDSFKV